MWIYLSNDPYKYVVTIYIYIEREREREFETTKPIKNLKVIAFITRA
jgi:hypothetical protein